MTTVKHAYPDKFIQFDLPKSVKVLFILEYNMLMDTAEPGEDFFAPDRQSEASVPPANNTQTAISWTASEFLYHQKSGAWYFAATVILLAIAFVSYLFTHDYIGPVSVVILGALLLVGASRKPRTVEYVIDSQGITVGTHEYAYDEFQSFSIVKEDQIESVALFPHKRLAPVLSIYFVPDDGQKIFDLLSDYLPFEQREKDQIDKFLHKIRF